MQLIDEIVEILGSEHGKISDALLKTKVLLRRLGRKDLVPWVDAELNGYSEGNPVPEYRILTARVLATVSNAVSRYPSHPIPLGHLTDEERSTMETTHMNQSLAVLEQFAAKDGGHLEAHIPMESYGYLGKNIDPSFQIERAWSEIAYSQVTQILVQVRSRLLDFVLDLQDDFPAELSKEDEIKRIGNIDIGPSFESAIFQGNTTIQIGSSNTQVVTNISLKGDFPALEETLKANNVSAEDITSLRSAIDKDSTVVNPSKKEFGPSVKSWLQRMLSKAIETSWDIEKSMVSSLLITALRDYYG